MQWLARRIQTFGVHVHVGLRDGGKAIPIVNALAAYLPHFLALTASSPFWNGEDTGLASTRAIIWGDLPTAGPPHRLSDWGEFEEYMDTLLRARTIRSIKEVWWDIRPHADLGTIEIRMFDGLPTAREVAWSPLCPRAWCSCSTPSWTAATSSRARHLGSFATTSGGRQDMVLTQR